MVGQVEVDGEGLARLGGDRLHRAARRLLVPSRDRDPAPLAREGAGDGAAESAASGRTVTL